MPSFSQISKDKLSQAHPDLQVIFNHVIKYYDCTVADSYRTKVLQEQYFNEGKSKVHYPTVHNTKPSNAVDVYPFEVNKIDYDLEQVLHFAGAVMMAAWMLYDQGLITHKIRNGGDWDKDNDINDNPFEDPGHFEIIPNEGEIFNYFEE